MQGKALQHRAHAQNKKVPCLECQAGADAVRMMGPHASTALLLFGVSHSRSSPTASVGFAALPTMQGAQCCGMPSKQEENTSGCHLVDSLPSCGNRWEKFAAAAACI